jgi:hypothetical protein
MFSQVTKPETAYIRDLHSRTRNLTAAQQSQTKHLQNIKRLDRYERSTQRTLFSRSSPEEFNIGELHRNYQPESRTLEPSSRRVTNSETITTNTSNKQTSLQGYKREFPTNQALYSAHSITSGASNIARNSITPIRGIGASTPSELNPEKEPELPAPLSVQSSSAENAKKSSNSIAGLETGIEVGAAVLAAI